MELKTVLVLITVMVSSELTVTADLNKRDTPSSENCLYFDNGICHCCESFFRKENTTNENCNIRCENCINLYLKGTCQEQCKKGRWGKKCDEFCPPNCARSTSNYSLCDKVTGKCSKNGCHNSNYYGDKCENNCSNRCVNNQCWRNGTCLQCNDRMYGDMCEKNCPSRPSEQNISSSKNCAPTAVQQRHDMITADTKAIVGPLVFICVIVLFICMRQHKIYPKLRKGFKLLRRWFKPSEASNSERQEHKEEGEVKTPLFRNEIEVSISVQCVEDQKKPHTPGKEQEKEEVPLPIEIQDNDSQDYYDIHTEPKRNVRNAI